MAETDDTADDRAPYAHAPGVSELSTAECWVLLERNTLARLGLVDAGGNPLVYPVNYSTFEGRILIGTGDDSKLRYLRAHGGVALEIDGEDEGMRWSVVIQGPALQVVVDAELRRIRAARPLPWHPGAKPFVIAIEPSSVTGRRFAKHMPGDPVEETPGPGGASTTGSIRGEKERPSPIPHFPPLPE